MKILIVSDVYPSLLRNFYKLWPERQNDTYLEQKEYLDYFCADWASSWSYYMSRIGYEAWDIMANNYYLQRAWAKENMLCYKKQNLSDVLMFQIKKYRPDVLFISNYDETLICRVKEENPYIRLMLGWVGSAVPKSNVWRHFDMVLSCAPETVDYFNREGLKACHLNHAFDPRLNERLKNESKLLDISFIGHLIPGERFHENRQKILEAVTKELEVEVFSPNAEIDFYNQVKVMLRRGIWKIAEGLRSCGIFEEKLEAIPIVKKGVLWDKAQLNYLGKEKRHWIKPGVFGLMMFQTLKNSKITINIHADSSPYYASNMRLFEATGVGTCLVTDWKRNLHELFEPEEEVVTFISAEECVEKAKWLLEYPNERKKIAKAGHLRTMKDHTYEKRAEQLDAIIKCKLN